MPSHSLRRRLRVTLADMRLLTFGLVELEVLKHSEFIQ